MQSFPPTLVHQSWGNRSEGLLSQLVAGGDAIALVSALASRDAPATFVEWPETLRLRFYLPPGETDADVSVRQLVSQRGFYALNQVTPLEPWKPETINEFRWSPGDVLARVYDWQQRDSVLLGRDVWLSRLGVVVDLGGPGQGAVNRIVAPAALRSTDDGGEVSSYRFTFRTSAAARAAGGVYAAGNLDRPVFEVAERDAAAGSPFTVRWPPEQHPQGWYRLVLNVCFGVDCALGDGAAPTPTQVTVRFYHSATPL